jgi:hypothetical protein
MMTKKTKQLLIQIAQQGTKLKEMLDFIQADGHFMERSKKLQVLGITSIEGTARRDGYRNELHSIVMQLLIAESILLKRPFAWRRYRKMTLWVMRELVKLNEGEIE